MSQDEVIKEPHLAAQPRSSITLNPAGGQVRCDPGAGNEGKELELLGDVACGTSLHPTSELDMPMQMYRHPCTESQGNISWVCKMPKEK